jgi:hypothetical protein
MRRFSWPFLVPALILALGIGCQSKPPMQPKVAGDPLLSSKKPVEGRPSSDAARDPATLYPLAPPAPIEDPDPSIRRVSVLPERIEGNISAPTVRLGEPQSGDH